MRVALILGLALAVACSGDDGDDGANGPDAGDGGGGTMTGTTMGGDDGGTSPVDTGTTAADGEPDSTGDETATPGDPTLCWETQVLGTVAGEIAGTAVHDWDSDGSEELWVWTLAVDLSSTELTRFGADDDETYTVPGALLTLSDFDGDGTADALMLDAPTEWSIYLGTGSGFDTMAIDVDAPPSTIVGAFDLDGDGSADLLQAINDNTLGAATAMGSGVFTSTSTLGVPSFARMDTVAAAAPDQFAVRSQPSPGDDGCNDNRIDTMAFVGGELTTSATGPMGMWEEPLAVVDVSGEGSPDVFVVACDTIPSVTNLRLLTDDGRGAIAESTVIDNVQWATPADVDGDGTVDVVWGDDVEGDMLVRLDVTTPEGTESTGIGAGTVEHNAVRVGDLDGAGGQEILRATANGGDTQYERIFVVDCE